MSLKLNHHFDSKFRNRGKTVKRLTSIMAAKAPMLYMFADTV